MKEVKDTMNENGFSEEILPGQLICQRRIFGETHRYSVAPVLLESGVYWYLWDAEIRDPNFPGKAALVAHSTDLMELIKYLPGLKDPVIE